MRVPPKREAEPTRAVPGWVLGPGPAWLLVGLVLAASPLRAQDCQTKVAPAVAFRAACSGVTCTFNLTSSPIGLVDLQWDFGDGATASGAATSATHTYPAAGVMAADGSVTRLDYQGTRLVLRTRRVWNGSTEVGGTTREEYDSLGRLRRIREPNKTWTYYWYDMGGRLSAVTANARGSQQQTRTFHYDGRGFLDREVQPESGAVSYKYDAQGNVTRKITPTGTIFYQYDAAGRLTQVGSSQAPLRILQYYPDGAAAGKLETAQAFNDRSIGSACQRFEVRQDFTYNATHGRLETERTSLFQGATPLEAWTQAYAYDGAGQVTDIGYPRCLAGCSAAERHQTFTYEKGRPTAVPDFATAITYHDSGLVKKITHSNGVTFTQNPDASGLARPGSLGTNRDWHDESYTYDASGNLKKIGGKLFSYDLSSRLISATVPGVSLPYRGYTYDVFGNMTQVAQGSSAGAPDTTYLTYTPNAATNRLQSAGYDNSGRLLSYQGSTYTWDVLSNLTKVNTGSEEWVHTYDAAGERVWSWRTGSARKDTYALRGLDGKVLTDFTKENAAYTWEDYVYREGQLLGAMYSDGRLVHFDVDHLGSVRQETDAAGAVIKYREFWPYGEEATPPSGTEQMKFTGHERDLGVLTSTADDLDYMHARYYKPLVGRFLSPDPVNGISSFPQGWNRYSYAKGNPLRFVDPTGTLAQEGYKCNGFVDCIYQFFVDEFNRHFPTPKATLSKENEEALAEEGVTSEQARQMTPGAKASAAQQGLNTAGAAAGAGLVVTAAIAGTDAVVKIGVDALSEAAATVIGRGELTAAGRALQKHAARAGSAFPRAVGNPAEISRVAQGIVDDILKAPGTTFTVRNTGRFGKVIDAIAVSGRGVRFSESGSFIGFLEP